MSPLFHHRLVARLDPPAAPPGRWQSGLRAGSRSPVVPRPGTASRGRAIGRPGLVHRHARRSIIHSGTAAAHRRLTGGGESSS